MIYIYISSQTEQGKKGRGKEVQSDDCKVAQPKRSGGALCIWQVVRVLIRNAMSTLVC